MLIEFKGSVLVVGDVMLDSFLEGTSDRISPEAPVPVVLCSGKREVAGGAANLAMNLASLGVSTTLIGTIGNDDSGITLSRILDEAGVKPELVRGDQPTTEKTRIMSGSHQLVRVDTEGHPHPFVQETVFKKFIDELPNAELVVLSDYAKGCISDPSIFIQACKLYGKKIFIDPKKKDLSSYKGATLLKPNEKEFSQHIKTEIKTEEEFIEAGCNLLKELELEQLLVTRGADGMVLFEPDTAPYYYKDVSKKVFDVTGAGDTVLAVIAACFCNKINWYPAISLASIAAGIAVENIGTKVISIEELNKRLKPKTPQQNKIIDDAEKLKQVILKAKSAGKKIVFTNGCFDILHSGHTKYLNEAAEQGDVLIVGVNSDESVQKLKGLDRPINILNDRMTILASLTAVDYVISFKTDTPINLIMNFMPDVLVKGGDYETKRIVGAQDVIRNGGRVHTCDFVPNISTSLIIKSVKKGRS